MPKTFLPWLRGSIDLNGEPSKPDENKAAEDNKETEAKKESKPDAKKVSGLNKLRGNK